MPAVAAGLLSVVRCTAAVVRCTFRTVVNYSTSLSNTPLGGFLCTAKVGIMEHMRFYECDDSELENFLLCAVLTWG